MAKQNYWQRTRPLRIGRREIARGGAAGGFALAVAGIVGCGSSTNNKGAATQVPATRAAAAASGSSAAASGSPAAAAATKTSGEQPRPGGTYATRTNSDPQALDIHQVSTYGAVWPEAPCYNQLSQMDPNDESDSKLVADLADKWEAPADGLSYTFHLHSGVKFHDGTPFTSADVKANLEWIKSPPVKKPSPRKAVIGAIDAIETPDANTVTIKLKQPNPSLLVNLASHYFAIGPKAVIDAKGDLGDQFIGTGPFKFKGYQRGESVQLVKNPDYWVSGRPYIDAMNFYVVGDDNTALTNFLGGQYTVLNDVKHEALPRVKSESGGKATVVQVPSTVRSVVFFNSQKAPWNDIRVRQAVSLALDRNEAIDTARGGDGEVGGYMRTAGPWGLPADQLKAIPGYDKGNVDQAKALLQQAGVSTPVKGSLLSRNDFGDFYTYVQQALARIGIQLDLDPEQSAPGYDKAYAGQFDLNAWLVGIVLDDPDATFAEIATSDAVRNWSRITDPEIDDLFKKQTVELDNAKRKQLVNQMDKKALSIFQAIQVYYQKMNQGVATNLRDYKFHVSLYTNERFQDAWFAK